MRNRKTLRVLLPALGALLVGIGWLLMERPHRDVGSEVAAFKMVPEELVTAFTSGDSAAAQYLNAVVELYAVVEGDDGKRVTMKGGVVAAWDSARIHRSLEPGELLRLKGRVTGYDDLFEEVRMDGLVIVHDQDGK